MRARDAVCDRDRLNDSLGGGASANFQLTTVRERNRQSHGVTFKSRLVQMENNQVATLN